MKYFLTLFTFLLSLNVFSAGGTGDIDVVRLRSPDRTKTWNMPAVSDTLVGKSTVDVFTNKSISGLTNTLTNITATTNANLTGPITSVGNATSVASQTGTGSTFVMNTSPTLTTPNIGVASGTSLTSPLLIGGTGTTSTLTLKPTSGAGTTGSDIIFGVGNNGATEAMRVNNSGNIGVGIAPLSSSKLYTSDRRTDPSSNYFASRSAAGATLTSNNAFSTSGLYVTNNPIVPAGVTASGTTYGIQVDTTMSNAGTGTVSEVYGQRVDFGNTTGSGATISNAYGLRLSPYAVSGTVGNLYSLYLSAPSLGGTLTSEFGVYQASPTAKNYFGGSLSVGASAPAPSTYKLQAGGTLTATTAVGIYSSPLFETTSTVNFAYRAGGTTKAAPSASFYHYFAEGAVVGAGSLTTQYGFSASSALTAGTSNIGFHSNLAAASGAWNFYAAGTANNYLGGALGIGSNSINANALLDVQSTTKASMPFPRMTTTQKNAITSPTAGMVVYDTTIGEQSIYKGTAWQTIKSGPSVNVTPGATGTTSDFSFVFHRDGSYCATTYMCHLDQIGTEVISVEAVALGTYTVTLARSYTRLLCTGAIGLDATTVGILGPTSTYASSTLTLKTFSTAGSLADGFGIINCKGTY